MSLILANGAATMDDARTKAIQMSGGNRNVRIVGPADTVRSLVSPDDKYLVIATEGSFKFAPKP